MRDEVRSLATEYEDVLLRVHETTVHTSEGADEKNVAEARSSPPGRDDTVVSPRLPGGVGVGGPMRSAMTAERAARRLHEAETKVTRRVQTVLRDLGPATTSFVGFCFFSSVMLVLSAANELTLDGSRQLLMSRGTLDPSQEEITRFQAFFRVFFFFMSSVRGRGTAASPCISHLPAVS